MHSGYLQFINLNMDTTADLIEPLIDRAGAYGKTSLDLLKLKALDKTTDVASTLISRIILGAIFSFFITALNIAVALWIGELLGKNYYGFLIVSTFYGVLAIVLYFIHPTVKGRINDGLIKHLLN